MVVRAGAKETRAEPWSGGRLARFPVTGEHESRTRAQKRVEQVFTLLIIVILQTRPLVLFLSEAERYELMAGNRNP